MSEEAVHQLTNVLSTINDLYEIKPVSVVERVAIGVSAENHVLANENDKYFLKRYRAKYGPDLVAQIHSAKQFCHTGGIPTVLPLPTMNGQTFFSIDGLQYALFPFVDGEVVDRYNPDTDALHAMATLEAKLHRLSEHGVSIHLYERDLSWDTTRFLAEAERVIGVIESQPTAPFNELAINTLRLKIELAKKNTTTYDQLGLKKDHLTHGDFNAENMFFTKEHAVKYLFDFERAALGPRSYDLFLTLSQTFLQKADHMEERIKRCCDYVADYHHDYPIPPAEIRAGFQLRYLNDIHTAWKEQKIFENHDERMKPFLEHDFAKLTWLSEHFEAISDQFAAAVKHS